jgi:hypothetical protein
MTRVGSAMSQDEKDFVLGGAIAVIFVLGAVIGLLLMNRPHQRAARAPISNHSTYAQVKAHFDGKPAGSGPYLAGFKTCSAWSNGRKGSHGHQAHGWILIGCSK